jgi:hypothetical protein
MKGPGFRKIAKAKSVKMLLKTKKYVVKSEVLVNAFVLGAYSGMRDYL